MANIPLSPNPCPFHHHSLPLPTINININFPLFLSPSHLPDLRNWSFWFGEREGVDLGPCLKSNERGSEGKLQKVIEKKMERDRNGMVLKEATINMKKKRGRGRGEE
jgi:hypothetical protein